MNIIKMLLKDDKFNNINIYDHARFFFPLIPEQHLSKPIHLLIMRNYEADGFLLTP